MSTSKTKALLSWSSGKDSAYTLFEVLKDGLYDVVGLVTTVTETFGRVSMHGVREEILDRQAESVGIPLHKIKIPSPCPNQLYEEKMETFLRSMKQEGVTHVIFGDLFLENLRRYREQNLAKLGLQGVFPLWLRDTKGLALKMIEDRFEAVITCIDPKKLPKKFCGSAFDHKFLASLPPHIDPCGENGEFHSMVHAAPIFKERIPVKVGKTVERDGFVFTDVRLIKFLHCSQSRDQKVIDDDSA
ncbi:MAG: diphthine--ammonia ligase [Deltaproteobacteria bacterium]|nr:diphthine--ammonia ligase [Deltaproteobacteria bacterium]